MCREQCYGLCLVSPSKLWYCFYTKEFSRFDNPAVSGLCDKMHRNTAGYLCILFQQRFSFQSNGTWDLHGVALCVVFSKVSRHVQDPASLRLSFYEQQVMLCIVKK